MSDTLLIADLDTQAGREPSICFQDINLRPAESTLQSHTIIPGFRAVNDSEFWPKWPPPDFPTRKDEYQKAFSNHKKVANRAVHLLIGIDGNLPSLPDWETIVNGIRQALPILRVGQTALIDGQPAKGHAKNSKGICAFHTIEFQFPEDQSYASRSLLISTQRLHFSCPTVKATDGLFTRGGTPAYDMVEIVSGMCLFSAKTLESSFLENGHLNVKKLRLAKPTLYEMEYIARSSSATADIASLIALRRRFYGRGIIRGVSLPVNITLDIPSFHYYHSINDRLELGKCTRSEGLQWMEAVELRCDQVAEVFRKAIYHELCKHGTQHSCDIRVSPKDNLLARYIHQTLEKGKNPSFGEIIQELNRQGLALWPEFHHLIPLKEKPQTFQALGYSFYVFQVVRPALIKLTTRQEKQPTSGKTPMSTSNQVPPPKSNSALKETPKPRRLIISIDDSIERKIYSKAQKILKKIRKDPESPSYPTLMEVYLCRRVFINSDSAGSNLYHCDPTPEIPKLSTLKARGEDGQANIEREAELGFRPSRAWSR